MKLTGISPVLLVADIERSVAFYRDRLGCACTTFGEPPTFASATRDNATFLFALCGTPDAIVPNWRITAQTWNAYVRVDDAEAAYAELRQRGATIDYELYDAPHGFREFGVQDPDGYDIGFGQPL